MTPLQQAAQAVVTRWDKTRYVMQDEMSALRDALSDEMAQAVEPAVSGATDGLSQDYNKGLGRWFADRLGARQQLRDDAHKAQQVAVPAVGNTACNPHPDAPHGFNRNASHSAGRYVCDCEGWTPDEAQ